MIANVGKFWTSTNSAKDEIRITSYFYKEAVIVKQKLFFKTMLALTSQVFVLSLGAE